MAKLTKHKSSKNFYSNAAPLSSIFFLFYDDIHNTRGLGREAAPLGYLFFLEIVNIFYEL